MRVRTGLALGLVALVAGVAAALLAGRLAPFWAAS